MICMVQFLLPIMWRSRAVEGHRTVATYEFDIIALESLLSYLMLRPLWLTRRFEEHGIQVN